MYERFTDRARKVMQLANQEAQRFNHEYIGTEHILIAIAKEGTGVGAKILERMNLGVGVVRAEVEKLIQPGTEMVTMGKLPQTPRTKKAVEFAMQTARELGHTYVGTEHLLLGLIREGEGVAAQVLLKGGMTYPAALSQCQDFLAEPRSHSVQFTAGETALLIESLKLQREKSATTGQLWTAECASGILKKLGA